jgi:predicted dehydrogenase
MADKKPSSKHSSETASGISRKKFLGNFALAAAGISIVPRHVLGGSGYTAPSDRIHLGYIGTGRQARGGLSGWFLNRDDVLVVAGCDVDSLKLEAFVNRVNSHYAEETGRSGYNDCQGYSDFRELLSRDDIDAVVIATPDHWHGVQGVMALDAGKDVYCEKPVSLTIKEGRAMAEAARRNERVFQTGSQQRSGEGFLRAAELVINGYIGEIEKVVVSVGGPPEPCDDLRSQPVPHYLDWNMWLGPAQLTYYNEYYAPPIDWNGWARWRYCDRFGGGAMTDWGAHMFDIAQWALGMDDTGPVEVIPPDESEYGVLTYKYANGIPMVREDFGMGNAVRFIGTEGTIDVSRSVLEVPENLENQQISGNDIRLYDSDHHYLDWIEAIRNRTKPICDVEIGHRTASVCTIGNITYKLNRTLRWDPEQEQFENDREANSMLHRPYRGPWRGMI